MSQGALRISDHTSDRKNPPLGPSERAVLLPLGFGFLPPELWENILLWF
jgi:hypothetical protein